MANEFNETKDNAIEKALHILDCFVPYDEEMGNTEISTLTGYNLATTTRILKILERNGFLYQNIQTRKYKLGRKIVLMNSAISNSMMTSFLAVARPYLLELRNVTGETVCIDLLSNNSIIAALAFHGNGPVLVNSPVGMAVQWNTCSGLRAILAYASQSQKDAFFSQPMRKVTPASVDDLDEYKKILYEVEKNGYASTIDEPAEGVAVISIPVFDITNCPIAAVSILGLKARILSNKELLLKELRATADSLTNYLSLT